MSIFDNKHWGQAIILALCLAPVGCSQQTINSAKQDTQRNLQAAKPQLAKLQNGARVTAALKAAGLDYIRVDADTNGVSLHGTVGTDADKVRAGRIARDTLGPEKHISNQLKVGGGQPNSE